MSDQERDDTRTDEERDDMRTDDEAAPSSTAELAAQGSRRDGDDDTEAAENGREPLFAGEDADRFRGQWSEIQGHFVDDPRRAVEEGDALVATLMQQLAETFADERSSLEQQWDRDGDVSTEDLRVALQRYRSFFDRLLSA
jgi:hypothetical protein